MHRWDDHKDGYLPSHSLEIARRSPTSATWRKAYSSDHYISSQALGIFPAKTSHASRGGITASCVFKAKYLHEMHTESQEVSIETILKYTTYSNYTWSQRQWKLQPTDGDNDIVQHVVEQGAVMAFADSYQCALKHLSVCSRHKRVTNNFYIMASEVSCSEWTH